MEIFGIPTFSSMRHHLLPTAWRFTWLTLIGQGVLEKSSTHLGRSARLRRPAGVKGGEVITEQHDIEMVSYLFSN